MQERILMMLVNIALERLTEGQLKDWADAAIDKLEDAVKETDTQVDDIIVLPLLKLIRAAFDIPDGED